jgi:uncharacterized membrane protein (DUF485 family)
VPYGVAAGDARHLTTPHGGTTVVEKLTPARHDAYERIHASADFKALKKAYIGFAFPMTVAFMVWYLTYVICSNWANDFMETKVIGNINVALVFGLLQFVSTFLIAFVYSRFAAQSSTPIAGAAAQYEEEINR